MPEGASWSQVYAMALSTGIGFAMSLFIGTLALDAVNYGAAIRIGCSSHVSAASCGPCDLARRRAFRPPPADVAIDMIRRGCATAVSTPPSTP
jgi:hypothetical protein